MASQAVCTEDINRINKIWHITQIHKVQILLFCYIDNYIFLCSSLLVSRFFYFKFLNQRKLISVTSEEFLLIYPI